MNESFKDGELLEALGKFARDEQGRDQSRFDDRLRRLCDGTLLPEEHDRLLADTQKSEELRLDYQTFSPLGESFQQKVLEKMRNRGNGSGDESAPTAEAPVAPIVPLARNGPNPSGGSQRGSPRRGSQRGSQRVRRSILLPLAAVLVAVLGGLYVWRAMDPKPPAGDGLVAYRMEIEGGRRDFRSGETDTPDRPAELPVFAVGDRLRLSLKPELETSEELQVKLFLVDPTERVIPWDTRKTFHKNGVVEVDEILDPELGLEPGPYRLVVLYGLPGRLPNSPSSELLSEGGDGTTWQTVEASFRLVPPEQSDADGALELPLEVQYAGCFSVGPGPSCVPYDQLTFWVQSIPDAEISLYLDGEPVSISPTEVDQGLRFDLPLELRNRQVVLEASDGNRESSYEIALAPSNLPPWLKEASRLGSEGRREQARSRLDGATPSPELRPAVLSLRARLADDEDERVALLADAIQAHCEQQNWLDRAYDLGMMVDLLLRRRDLGTARTYLDSDSCPGSDIPAEAEILRGYYFGILHNDSGNYRDALSSLERARAMAGRLNLKGQEVKVQLQIALTLQRIGRAPEAAELLKGLAEKGLTESLAPCDQVRFSNNLAWTLAAADFDDPIPWLDRAGQLAQSQDCGEDLALDLRINRALSLESQDRIGEANGALGEALELENVASPFHKLWLRDVEGRIALKAGQFEDALQSYFEMEALSHRAADPHGLWRAKVQQAAAHEALGRDVQAAKTYSEAENLLADQRLRIPLDAGREAFLQDREVGARRYLDLLLRLGRLEEAAQVARMSRARALSSIRLGHRLTRLSATDQLKWDSAISDYLRIRGEIESDVERDRLRLDAEIASARVRRTRLESDSMKALDQAFAVVAQGAHDASMPNSQSVDAQSLPSPAEDELVLLYHPLPRGWVGFALRSDGIETHRFELPEGMGVSSSVRATPETQRKLSERLLEPFSTGLSSKGKVRILAYGALQPLDFHALPWAGDVLLASHSVVYGLDLSPSKREPVRQEGALVVVDPSETLGLAGREADRVEAALKNRFHVRRLAGREAGLGTLLAEIPKAELFHFVGHSRAGGPFGWESALELAGQGRLTLGDILSLPQSPARVVLASCEGAEVAETAPAGLGLAQAFVIAGSGQVVASTRNVKDRDAQILLGELYRQPGHLTDFTAGLRLAQLALRDDPSGVDWSAFRVLVP